MDDTEDKVLEAIRNMEALLDKMSKSNEEEITKPGVMILLEQTAEDIENFNISMFDYNKDKKGLDEEYPICTIIACGLLSILETQTDFVFSEGLEHLRKKYEREMEEAKKGEVVNLHNYKKKKCEIKPNGTLTSKIKWSTKGNKKGDDDYDA